MLDRTTFYAEQGGQEWDEGCNVSGREGKIKTQKNAFSHIFIMKYQSHSLVTYHFKYLNIMITSLYNLPIIFLRSFYMSFV